MRILVWNIQDLFLTKIKPERRRGGKEGKGKKAKTVTLLNYADANDVRDFIAKLVTCYRTWANVPFLQNANGPIDLFVIVEVEECVKIAGSDVNANYPVLMRKLVKSINQESAIRFPGHPPVYDYVRGANVAGGYMVSAGDETFGFIYNSLTLAPLNGGLVVNPGNPLPTEDPAQRLPFLMNFTSLVGGNQITVIANHAPPKGRGDFTYQASILYTNQLQNCTQVNFVGGLNFASIPLNAATPRIFIVGDFNCSIDRFYPDGTRPFQNLYVHPPPAPGGATVKFGSVMGNTGLNVDANMRTSVKGKLKKGFQPKYPRLSYLEEQYDDIIYSYPIAPLNSGVLDLVGELIDYTDAANPVNINNNNTNAARFSGWINSFNSVSDHLPMGIQFI